MIPPRQFAVLRFIYDSWFENGYPPTIREIGDALGIRSTNGVNDHLLALRKKGLVKNRAEGPTRSRTLQLTEAGHDAVENAEAA